MSREGSCLLLDEVFWWSCGSVFKTIL